MKSKSDDNNVMMAECNHHYFTKYYVIPYDLQLPILSLIQYTICCFSRNYCFKVLTFEYFLYILTSSDIFKVPSLKSISNNLLQVPSTIDGLSLMTSISSSKTASPADENFT